MKAISYFVLSALCVFLVISSCQRQSKDLVSPDQSLGSKPAKTKMDMPTLSCGTSSVASIDLQVCAGETGAPAGFSVQWMTLADFVANGSVWPADETGLCKASFAGNANGSRYNLAPNECVTVRIGDILFDNGTSASCIDELVCGTTYVFRAFAHATSTLRRSDFTNTKQCSTSACQITQGGCTYSQGYWKSHGPVNCNPSSSANLWPITSVILGTVSYTQDEMCSIFNTPAAGNSLISLAHQLMAAKINIANGADGSSIAATIAAADALIGNLIIPPVGAGSLGSAGTLITDLENYNLGVTGPGHCQ